MSPTNSTEQASTEREKASAAIEARRVPAVGHGVRPALAFVALLLPLLAPLVARAAQPPILYHSTLPGHTNPGTHQFGPDAEETLELYLATGTVATNTTNREVCVDGQGDEVCGFTLVLETTGGLSLVEFCPGGQCAPDLVHHLDPQTGRLKINRLGPAVGVSDGPLYVGHLRVASSGAGGELRVHEESEAVAANLVVMTVRDNAPLPEPGVAWAVAIGLLGLVVADRRRRAMGARSASGRDALTRSGPKRCAARRRPAPSFARALGAGLGVGLAALADPGLATAQSFTNEALFVSTLASLGESPERLGFEALPLSASGFAALRNGVRLGPVRLSSTSLPGNVDLAWVSGVPLGLVGTMLVADPTLSGDPALWPGGTGVGAGALRNDDLRIEFDVPVRAAGLRILENVVQPGESITFLDANDVVIASFALPGSGSLPGADGFAGYLIQAGDAPIAAIEIDESDANLDDIGIDEILFESGADPFADQVAGYTPTVQPPGEPTVANRVPAESLGAPDGGTVSLGVGGKLIVRFVDNTLTGSGNALPDLRIHEGGATAEGSLIEVSANGAAWISVGTIEGGVQTIDLDAFGLDENDVLSFVRIVDDPAQGSTSGPSVGADIDAVEALSGTFLPVDGDGDHVPDAYDDCPGTTNPAQRDDDGDGIGNVCDNCRHVPNFNQLDADLDGQGNACEPARVRLIRDSTPVLSEGRADLAELRIDCGGFDVYAITLGIWLPPGPAGFGFGGGCDAPPSGWQPPGAPTGAGCVGPNIAIGPTVAPLRSGAFTLPITLARPDVLFVVLRGAQANGGKLCSAFETDVRLGRLGAAAPLMLTSGSVASISLEDVLAFGWCPTEDGSGSCAEPEDTEYRLEGGEITPASLTLGPRVAEIVLQPAAGEASATASAWDICIADTTVSYMHRVTMGLLGPLGASYSTLYLDGCLDGPDPDGERSCGGEVGIDPERVDESVTFTRGPLGPAGVGSSALLEDTLYTPIDGGAPGTGGLLVLNPYLSRDSCIGGVTNGPPPATPGAPPIPVRDGFFELAYHDLVSLGEAQPYQTADLVLQSLSGGSVYETIVFNQGDDLDADGFTDPVDNCPFAANPDQSDDGGFETTEWNGQGNACECGDANGSGAVIGSAIELGGQGGALVPDLQLIREYLVGMHEADPHIPTICSVQGDTACDTADAVVLERAFSGANAVLERRCDAAVD